MAERVAKHDPIRLAAKQFHAQTQTTTTYEPTAESWRSQGSCQWVDPELFFPVKGGSALAAKRICSQCSVRVQCLEYALRTPRIDGIWGGTSERERCRIRAMENVAEVKQGWRGRRKTRSIETR